MYDRIEITCNFVMDETLSDAHYDALMVFKISVNNLLYVRNLHLKSEINLN